MDNYTVTNNMMGHWIFEYILDTLQFMSGKEAVELDAAPLVICIEMMDTPSRALFMTFYCADKLYRIAKPNIDVSICSCASRTWSMSVRWSKYSSQAPKS